MRARTASAEPEYRVDESRVRLKTIGDHAWVNFLQTDLAAALTIARIALQSTDPEKRARTSDLVRKAYDSVLHFIPRVRMSESEARTVHQKLQELGENLATLAQSV